MSPRVRTAAPLRRLRRQEPATADPVAAVAAVEVGPPAGLEGTLDGSVPLSALPGVVTVGVAVAVPDPHGRRLQRWRADFGDPLAWSIPAHVTLVPPTPVAAEDLPRVHDHLAEVARAHAPFTMVLRGTATFRPVSPVVFVRVAAGTGECGLLERAVRSGPLASPRRFAFHPHVTVAHDLEDEALDRAQGTLAGYAAEFGVEAFGLYEHGADGVWRDAARFPLAAG